MSHDVKKPFKQGRMLCQMFGDGMIALNKELATGLHPKLEALLKQHPVEETEVRLAQIAQYCEIILDATYSPEEIDRLASILAGRLEVLRELPGPQIVQ